MRFDLCPGLVQVELLSAEAKRHPPAAEQLTPHPELLVEASCRVDVSDRENEMVEGSNPHSATNDTGIEMMR